MKTSGPVNQVCDFRDKETEKQEFFSKKKITCYENRGLIRGPNEPEDQFLERVLSASPHPFPEKALAHFETLFQMRPDWVPLLIDKKSLKPWEGAVAWIEESSVKIQIRSLTPPFSYSLEEILAHELVHAVRLSFQEPLFEEILAFRTSKNRVRRFLGPLFSTPRETYLFLITLLGSWAGYWVGWGFDWELLRLIAWMCPVLFFIVLLIKLIYLQNVFQRALTNLETTLDNPSCALNVLLTSSDEQIKHCAKSTRKIVDKFKSFKDL